MEIKEMEAEPELPPHVGIETSFATDLIQVGEHSEVVYVDVIRRGYMVGRSEYEEGVVSYETFDGAFARQGQEYKRKRGELTFKTDVTKQTIAIKLLPNDKAVARAKALKGQVLTKAPEYKIGMSMKDQEDPEFNVGYFDEEIQNLEAEQASRGLIGRMLNRKSYLLKLKKLHYQRKIFGDDKLGTSWMSGRTRHFTLALGEPASSNPELDVFGQLGKYPEVKVAISASPDPDSVSYKNSPGMLRFGQAMYEVDHDRIPRRVVLDVYRTNGSKGTLVAEYTTLGGLFAEDAGQEEDQDDFGRVISDKFENAHLQDLSRASYGDGEHAPISLDAYTPGKPGIDYISKQGVITFPEGVTHQQITMLIHGKTNREAISQSGSYDFRMRLSTRSAQVGAGQPKSL